MKRKDNELEIFNIFKERGFKYDPELGYIFGIKGGRVDRKNNTGYYRVGLRIRDKSIDLLSHRLGWFLYYNEIPNEIDHINGDRMDNRISNLRNFNRKENQHNRMGRGWKITPSNKYHAQITNNGENIWLGNYNTPEEAHQAYLNAKKIYHPECQR